MYEIPKHKGLKLVRAIVSDARLGRPSPIEEGELGDWHREDVQLSMPMWLGTHQGWVYLASNDAFPGLFKIGCTRKSVAERMATLNSSGVVAPWLALHQWSVLDAFGVEAQVHAALARRKVRKEFFLGPAAELCEEVTRAVHADERRLNAQFAPFLGCSILDCCAGVRNEVH